MSIFGAAGNKIIREVIKKAGEPLVGESLERAVAAVRWKQGVKSISGIAKNLRVTPEQVRNVLEKYGWLKGMKGAASIAGLGTLAAGAAVVGAWAYPAKKLGEYLGKKIEARKAIKRNLEK